MNNKIVGSQHSTVNDHQFVGVGVAPVKNDPVPVVQFTTVQTFLRAKFFAVACFLFAFVATATAQTDSMIAARSRPVDMATTMRSNGKIYVVVAVLVVILSGIFLYLIRLDRKISRLEKNH